MKHLNTFILAALCVILTPAMLVSCSDEDIPPKPPVIEKIDIYRGLRNTFAYSSSMIIDYKDGNVNGMVLGSPTMHVSFSYYSTDSVSFDYYQQDVYGEYHEGRSSLQLSNGIGRICKSSRLGNVVYSYDNNYLTNTIFGDTQVNYIWKDGNLSSITSTNPLYKTDFTPSSVVNDYNIDLNIINQLIDQREKYRNVRNTFAQMIDLLGKRSKYLLEDTQYYYKYTFDDTGKLSSIFIRLKKPDLEAKVEVYAFVFYYSK